MDDDARAAFRLHHLVEGQIGPAVKRILHRYRTKQRWLALAARRSKTPSWRLDSAYLFTAVQWVLWSVPVQFAPAGVTKNLIAGYFRTTGHVFWFGRDWARRYPAELVVPALDLMEGRAPGDRDSGSYFQLPLTLIPYFEAIIAASAATANHPNVMLFLDECLSENDHSDATPVASDRDLSDGARRYIEGRSVVRSILHEASLFGDLYRGDAQLLTMVCDQIEACRYGGRIPQTQRISDLIAPFLARPEYSVPPEDLIDAPVLSNVFPSISMQNPLRVPAWQLESAGLAAAVF